MTLEVELKFPVPDPAEAEGRIANTGAKLVRAGVEKDLYFNHPSRDFAQTDEALRIRTTDKESRITWKGPVLGPVVRTRQEIEVPLDADQQCPRQLARILARLGFREVRTVRKSRLVYRLIRDNQQVEFSVDTVDELGSFVEIETLCDEDDRRTAEQLVLKLAEELGFRSSEKRSYLDLLLEQDARAVS